MKKVFVIISMAFGFTIMAGSFSDLQAQTTKTKKGWSHKKKYAVVGGVAGAATGAAVSHKHAKGAVIGGVVGAGSGYLLGRHKDKKKGKN